MRRIFELSAEGVGQKRIACRLNTEGLPSPLAQQGRPQSWCTASVHSILNRSLYRGEVVYNKTRKRDQWGQKRSTRRPESEWLRHSVPELRIVDQTLWDAAHARIDEHRRNYLTATKGLRGGQRRVESKYLLPGMATCGSCGGGLTVRTHNHGSAGSRRRVFFYGCSTRARRGVNACPNPVQIPMDLIDTEVLRKVRDLLTPRLVECVVGHVRTLMEPDQAEEQREQLTRERDIVEGRIGRLTSAIAAGDLSIPELVAQLQDEQRRRQALTQALADLDARRGAGMSWPEVEAQARALLHDWRGLLGRHGSDARPVLRQLLEGRRIRFTPVENGKRRGYRFEGDAGLGGMLDGLATTCHVGWRPHRDSNPGFSLERAAS